MPEDVLHAHRSCKTHMTTASRVCGVVNGALRPGRQADCCMLEGVLHAHGACIMHVNNQLVVGFANMWVGRRGGQASRRRC